MANITQQNNIRYCIDTLNLRVQGVLISDTYAFDLSSSNNIDNISLSYSQPSGTEIFLLFAVNDLWGRFSNNNFVHVDTNTDEFSFDTIKTYGNTPADINKNTNFQALAGNRVRVAAALAADNPSNAVPRIKISAVCRNTSQTLHFSKLSSVFNLDDAQIISILPNSSTKGSGKTALFAQITDKNNLRSDWLPSNNFLGKNAKSIQLRADYSVQDINSAAQIDNVKIVYSPDSFASNAASKNIFSTQLYSITQDWHMNLKSCRLTLKHSPLLNSSIRAFASLRSRPSEISHEQLGIGTGTKKTFQLSHTENIQYDSVKLFFDGQECYSNFELNTAAGRITCNAPEGVIISCSYNYNWQNEIWLELSQNYSISYDNFDQSEFRGHFNEIGQVCAIKIILDAQTGHITSEKLGTGTNKTQTYKLSHPVKDGAISIFENGTALSSKYFSLHDDNEFISIAAGTGKTLTANYDWAAKFPVIYQFAAVFSE